MHSFKFRWIPLLATVLLCAVFLKLAWWQWSKATELEQRIERQAQLDHESPLLLGSNLVEPSEAQGRMVEVRGRYDFAAQFFLDNQQHQGRPGLHVITPLVVDGSQTRLWVDRGWVGWGQGRDVLPQVPEPQGVLQLRGRLMAPNDKPPAFVSEPVETNAKLRIRVHLNELRQSSPYPVQPLLLQVFESSVADNLVREWPPLENKVPMHKGYALQWLLITLLTVGFFVRSSRSHNTN